MRRIGRSIGYLLVAFALAALVWDLLPVVLAGKSFHLSSLGEVWARVHFTSLQLAQPAIERHIAPLLWDPVIVTVLLWPAVLVLGVPGLLLALVLRAKPDRKFFKDS